MKNMKFMIGFLLSVIILLSGSQFVVAGSTSSRISSGAFHSLFLRSDGTVLAWGAGKTVGVDPQSGQSLVPAGLTGVTAVFAGSRSSTVLKSDGTVVAWGIKSVLNTRFQNFVSSGITGVIDIADGRGHAVGLKSDGTVVAWGDNSFGQTTVPAGLIGVTAVAVGGFHSLALKSDGTVVAWGAGSTNTLGTVSYKQAIVPAGLTGVTAIAADYLNSIALKSDGTVVVWGDNSYGQLSVPVGLTGVRKVVMREGTVVALKQDGTVVAWGRNFYGEATVPVGLSGVKDIVQGLYTVYALKIDGTVVAWGRNDVGQATIPAGLSGVTEISAGFYFAVALKSDESAVILGSTAYGASVLPTELQFQVGLEQFQLLAQQPANVSIQFRAFNPLSLAPKGALNSTDFIVKEDGLPLSVESYYEVKHDNLNTVVDMVLMFDISSSINTRDLQTMKQAAKAVFLDANGNNLLQANQRVAVYVFDSAVTMIQDFTNNPNLLVTAVDGISSNNVASTNMFGAIVDGMARLAGTNQLDTVFAGQMVLITDGRDTSGLKTLSQAQSAIGSNLLYVIGVQSPDLDVTSINQLTSHYTPISNFAQVETALRNVNLAIQDYAKSFYQVLYTTPARGGTHSLRLSVKSNLNTRVNATITGTYDAAGFSNPVAEMVIEGGSTLAVGASLNLQGVTRFAAHDPFAYTWTVDDASVGSLIQDTNDGSLATLSGLKKGVVNITVKDVRYPNLSYVQKIVVDDVFVLINGQATTILNLTSGTTASLQAKLPQGSATTPQYTWSIADSSVATIDRTSGSNITITPVKGGNTALVLTDTVTGATTTVDVVVDAGTGAGASTGGSGGGGGCLAGTSNRVMKLWPMLLFLVFGLWGIRRKELFFSAHNK